MATTDRPSGLTALAVINFLLSFLQLLSAAGFLLQRFVFAPYLLKSEEDFGDGRRIQELVEVSPPVIILIGGLMLLSALLLFISGFGYLRRKRVWGKHITTLYVICDLVSVACILAWMPESYIRDLGIGLIRTVFYPVFLGVVIHTVFRRDLVR